MQKEQGKTHSLLTLKEKLNNSTLNTETLTAWCAIMKGRETLSLSA